MKISPVLSAPVLALLLILLFLFPAAAGTSSGPSFDSLRLNLNAKPPAACEATIYGTLAARAPDGALCLCHQSFDGKQGFWEQIGTGRPCWPDKK